MGAGKGSMIDYKLSPEAMIMIAGSSKGVQAKYYSDGFWYKKNSQGYEGIAEALVTEVLHCSNLGEYAVYETCLINGAPGCRSQSFLKPTEALLSFHRLYDLYGHGSLSEQIRLYDKVSDRIEFVIDFIYENISLDVREYLSWILALDMLTLNDDRHFNNLAIIADSEKNIYRCAPIFDNGGALLSSHSKYPVEDDLSNNIEKVIAQPFSINHEAQAEHLGISLKIDYKRLYNALDAYSNSRAKEVLLYQLRRYENEVRG